MVQMVNMDIPIQSSVTIPHESDSTSEFDRAPSATTPNPTSQVETVMSKVEVTEKVVSKVASNKVMSKAEMVENRFKSSTLSTHDYSALFAHREALLAAQLESERVELDTRVQKNKAAKLANLKTAKDGGGISLKEYKQQVKALLNQ
jgi:ribosomal protein L7/L12